MLINRKRRIIINQIDVNYRDLANVETQYEIMKYILNCLSDEQLNTAKKLIDVWKQHEKEVA